MSTDFGKVTFGTPEEEQQEILATEIFYLDPVEQERLSAWLVKVNPPCPPEINWGRFQFMILGASNYISHTELACLMDQVHPIGFALEILQGKYDIRRIV